MMVREVTYRLEMRHRIALVLSFAVFVLAGVFVIYTSLYTSRPVMILSASLFAVSLLALVAAILITGRKSAVKRFIRVTSIKTVKVEPRDTVTAIFRNRFFQAVVLIYLISAILMVISKSPQPLPVFLVTMPAFLTATAGRLSREITIAREGIVIDNSLIRWEKVNRLEFHENVVVLLNDSGFPVAVLPRTPEIEEILRGQAGKQNV